MSSPFLFSSYVEFDSSLTPTQELERHVAGLIQEAEEDPELAKLVQRAEKNSRRFDLQEVPDPVYGRALTNGRPIPPGKPGVDIPLAIYAGRGHTAVIFEANTEGSPRHDRDFYAGEFKFGGKAYQVSMRAPLYPGRDESLASLANHRCKHRGSLPPVEIFSMGAVTIKVPVMYVTEEEEGLEAGTMLEYDYGADYWSTLEQLERKPIPPGMVVEWCLCRHTHSPPASCPHKRGRLKPA